MIRKIIFALLVAAAAFPLGGASGCDDSVNDDDVTIPVTIRVSISSASTQGNADSEGPSISSGGRYVVFTSLATNLTSDPIPGNIRNVYLRDLEAKTTELVSVTAGGTGANGNSTGPRVSADGRYVVFTSLATDLVLGLDDNTASDIFMRDRASGTTSRLSQTTAGAVGNGASQNARMSSDGRFVVFESAATNLEATVDTNGSMDVFLWDRNVTGLERVSLRSDGGIPTGSSQNPDLSENGRFIVYDSQAADMITGDAAGKTDVFIRDRQLLRTERVSVAFPFGDPNGHSEFASISADGRFVAFQSQATNLTPETDVNLSFDMFVRDLGALTTTLVSRNSSGALGFGSSYFGRISKGGTRVAYLSEAPNLVEGDTNGNGDIFLFDIPTGGTQRVSVRTFGVQPSDREGSYEPDLSFDGRIVTFESESENLVDDDSNGVIDVFVRSPIP
jgi:Tol biopolymer transport system component